MSVDWLHDPYGEFLDLPPGDRPPHYYELLELEIFCAQRERIEHAVRKQFRKIKPYQDHPDRKMREAIQDVMTLIAQARVVLTDPERKEAYDRELAESVCGGAVGREGILASRMATPVPEFALAITAGPTHVGETVELLTDTKVTIGRDPHCVIPLTSPRLGTLHGELRHQDGRWSYTHVDPRRITVIDEERVTRKDLQDGDRIEAGGYALRFRKIGDLHPPAAADRPPITLIVTRGPSVPDAIFNALAPEPVLIGECETALWQLGGPQVARHHCRVLFEADRWTIVDLRSADGTLLNGQRVTRSPIDNRDTLTIGCFEVIVRLRT